MGRLLVPLIDAVVAPVRYQEMSFAVDVYRPGRVELRGIRAHETELRDEFPDRAQLLDPLVVAVYYPKMSS